jgi:hypothetical protein
MKNKIEENRFFCPTDKSTMLNECNLIINDDEKLNIHSSKIMKDLIYREYTDDMMVLAHPFFREKNVYT